MKYPKDTAGFKGLGTSREAAQKITPKRPKLWQLVLAALEEAPGTPEQITERIRRRGYPALLMSIRPRCSELMQLGKIVPTGNRGRGEGGCACHEYRLATEEERALWLARQEAEAEARREAA